MNTLLKTTLDELLEWAKKIERAWYVRANHRLTQQPRPSRPALGVVRSVLVFKPDEIGDVVLSLPALADLRNAFPEAQLTVACKRQTAPIFERLDIVDKVVPLDIQVILQRFRRVDLRPLLNDSPDLAIFLRTGPKMFRDFLKLPARLKVHPLDVRMPSVSPFTALLQNQPHDPAHQSLQVRQIVAAVSGIPPTWENAVYPKLHWKEGDFLATQMLGNIQHGPYLVVHPFSEDETRRYPERYWDEVLSGVVANTDFKIVIVGSQKDRIQLRVPHLNLAGRLSIAQTAHLLSSATAMLGTLSGPAHLSAYFKRPTYVMMSGHSAPGEWAPLNAHLFRFDVDCSPCYRKTCPWHGLKCLRSLTPEHVLPELIPLLQEDDSRL